jgi:hypothetical protein
LDSQGSSASISDADGLKNWLALLLVNLAAQWQDSMSTHASRNLKSKYPVN